MRDHVLIYVNGERIEVLGDDVFLMLADWLRRLKGLTGTKIVCAEGDCGACSVLMGSPRDAKPVFQSINSCITTVAQMDGSSLVTVEGLAIGDRLNPVQEAMRNCHGSQCGFCTPGFVMAMAGLVEQRLHQKNLSTPISEKEAKNALTANLCRCTGYLPIIEAAKSISIRECTSLNRLPENSSKKREFQKIIRTPLRVETESFTFYAPTQLEDAGRFLKAHPEASIVSGATDLGVIHNKRKKRLKRVLSLHLVPELYRIQRKGKNRLFVGARVTLSELRNFLKGKDSKALIPEFVNFLDLFASPQIKNQATLVGNLANASPIGDTSPFLRIVGTTIHTHQTQPRGPSRSRKISIDDFFVGYRKTSLFPLEFITGVEFDIPQNDELIVLKKVSQRKDLDISTVNAAFRFKRNPRTERIQEARIAYGGVAATPLRIFKLEQALRDLPLKQLAPLQLVSHLHEAITPLDDLRSSASFRRVTSENLLVSVLQQLSESV